VVIVSKVSEDGTVELELLPVVELVVVVTADVVGELEDDVVEVEDNEVEEEELEDDVLTGGAEEVELLDTEEEVTILEVVVFTLFSARNAAPPAIRIMTTTTAIISTALPSPVLEVFKLRPSR